MIFYSTDCPSCKAIEAMLVANKIKYEKAPLGEVFKVADANGINDVPFAKIDGKIYQTQQLKNFIMGAQNE